MRPIPAAAVVIASAALLTGCNGGDDASSTKSSVTTLPARVCGAVRDLQQALTVLDRPGLPAATARRPAETADRALSTIAGASPAAREDARLVADAVSRVAGRQGRPAGPAATPSTATPDTPPDAAAPPDAGGSTTTTQPGEVSPLRSGDVLSARTNLDRSIRASCGLPPGALVPAERPTATAPPPPTSPSTAAP